MMLYQGKTIGRMLILGLSLLGWNSPSVDAGDPPNEHPAVSPKEMIKQSSAPEQSPPHLTIRREREVRNSIEAWQTRVQGKVIAIDKLAAELDLKKIQGQRLVAGELKDMLNDLDEEAEAIIEAYEALGPDLELYRKALEAAPSTFMQFSSNLEKSAIQTRSPILQQTYADFANDARKYATYYGDKAKSIQSLEVEVEEKIGFVRESREFFAEVRKLLDAIPAESGLATERLVERMNQYIDVFQSAMNAMRGVGAKIVDKKESPSNSSPQSKEETATSKESKNSDPFAKVGLKK